MFNFILVSFCFLLILGLGLGSVIGLGFGIGNLKIFDRWRWWHSGHPRPLDACHFLTTDRRLAGQNNEEIPHRPTNSSRNSSGYQQDVWEVKKLTGCSKHNCSRMQLAVNGVLIWLFLI